MEVTGPSIAVERTPMPDFDKLPHLIRLLDDPSETVQEALAREFSAFGADLDAGLAALDDPLTPEQRQRIEAIRGECGRIWLRNAWPDWYGLEGDGAKLEEALGLIAAFQYGPDPKGSLGEVLDELADAFRRKYEDGTVLDLARYLFEERGLEGAGPEDYYAPLSSNLLHVVETGRGLPISLACIYILVGRRLGFSVQGCNWPGHFLAVARHDGETMLVDCFHGGSVVDEDAFLRMQGPSKTAAQEVVRHPAAAEVIVARVLSNLIRAYEIQEHWPNRQLMAELLLDLERRFLATP